MNERGDLRGAALTGSVPKAVSWHELEVGPTSNGGWHGWLGRVTVDI